MKRKIYKQEAIAMVIRICGDKIKPCYDNKTGEKLRYLEVTLDIFKKGLFFIAEEDTPKDKDGMAEVTFLDIGDFVVITNKGVRRLKAETFRNNFNF